MSHSPQSVFFGVRALSVNSPKCLKSLTFALPCSQESELEQLLRGQSLPNSKAAWAAQLCRIPSHVQLTGVRSLLRRDPKVSGQSRVSAAHLHIRGLLADTIVFSCMSSGDLAKS